MECKINKLMVHKKEVEYVNDEADCVISLDLSEDTVQIGTIM